MIEGKNYIGGKFQPNRQDFKVINPSTEEAIGLFPQSTIAQVNEACTSAKNAFSAWNALGRVKRGDYFHRLANLIENKRSELVKTISLETGKSLNESDAEVTEALHMVQYTAAQGRQPSGSIIPSEVPERDSYLIRKPKGVIGVISPWNFSYAIPYWNSAPALLEGNTVVLKPSEDAPMSGQLIAELYDEAGFPAGTFNMIHGDGSVGAEIVNHHFINHILFTGSVTVGQQIRQTCAKFTNKSCALEMGSKSAVIVCADSDLDISVPACIASSFKLTGQRCVSAGRILVDRKILRSFLPEFVAKVEELTFGDPFSKPVPFAGPLINKSQMERVIRYNDMVRKDRSTQIYVDGKKQDGKGFFVNPFVYQAEWADKPFLREEVFGGHVAIIPFDDNDEAIRIFNDTQYGLSVGVITNDYRAMREFRERCDCGMCYFNNGSIGAESSFPFGGVKASGYGHASAAGCFDGVVNKVAVTINHGRTINFPQGLK